MKRAALSALLCVAAAGCPAPPDSAKTASEPAKTGERQEPVDPKVAEAQMFAKAIYGELPSEAKNANNPQTPAKVALGKTLYYDGRLSKSGEISCNSCHQLDKFGVDAEPTSPGHTGERGTRNSPTVYNAALHEAGQFWDAREPDVEAQAKGPILNPVEMGMASAEEVIATLKGIAGYAELFKQAFPGEADPITYDNVGKAIGAFERTLLTPARFDKFVAGDASALTPEEIAGMQLFHQTGCTQCHTGPALGGNAIKKLGDREAWETKDLGRYEVTKQDADKYMFKVPSLRNVTRTGPYLHDGSISDLGEMVKLMAKHQLAKELKDEEVDQIVAFLDALTGEIKPEWTQAPAMPK